MADLDNLYKWFDENRDSIIDGHSNECALLKDNSVIGYFPDTDTALSAAQEKGFLIGDFLIQNCISKDDECMYYTAWNF